MEIFFAIGLDNSTYCVGQVLGQNMVNTLSISIYNELLENLENVDSSKLCSKENIISIIEVTKEQLTYGVWKILGNKELNIPQKDFPNEKFRNKGWVGAKTYDAALAEDFVNAYYALKPWDSFFDASYLDQFLIDISKKPVNLIWNKD